MKCGGNSFMKKLILMRHAKSSWDDSAINDFERPLNTRGKHDAPEMGKRLAKLKILPELMVSSPAKRARKTAKVVAKEIGYPKDKIVLRQEIYEAGTSDLLEVIRKFDNSHSQVMMFGHNPGFTSLANLISDCRIDNIPTCGVFCVEFPVADWSEITPGCGAMVFFDYPKNPAVK